LHLFVAPCGNAAEYVKVHLAFPLRRSSTCFVLPPCISKGLLFMDDHQFLRYIPPNGYSRAIRDVSLDLMNFYFGKNWSRSKWLKLPPYSINCFEKGRDENGNETRRDLESKSFRIIDLEKHIKENSGFKPEEFNLFEPRCKWLDVSVKIASGFHIVDENGVAVELRTPLPLGDNFPILPSIDREGHIYSSMQMLLQKSVVNLHKRLIVESSQFYTDEWFNFLRLFIADSVSLIDITLHHLYTKAEFDPLPGWNFNRVILRHRENRRLDDKLRWVGQITSRPLDDAKNELDAFHRLRKVRNHLQHFDPPCFGFTLEKDVLLWLNSASLIGRLAWKIRKRLGSPITVDLIELIVAPEVGFSPKHSELKRKPQSDNVGYASSCWPNQVQDDKTDKSNAQSGTLMIE
jgi:hypothetical protein